MSDATQRGGAGNPEGKPGAPGWDSPVTRRAALRYGGGFAGMLSISGLLAACGGVSDDEGGSGGGGGGGGGEGDLLIGNISSLSGGLSPFGQSITNGLMLGVAHVNASGGVGGRKIKVVTADTKSDPAHALQQARRLITQEKVDVIFGLEGSNLRDAVSPFSSQNKVPLFYPANYEGGIYDPYMFVNGLVPSQEFNATFMKKLRDEAKGPRVYHIGSDYAWPRVTSKYFAQAAYPEAGLELVGEDFVPMTQTNLAPNLTKLLRAKPDIVINNVIGEAAISFQRAIAAQGVAETAVWGGSAYQQMTVKAMGADADGAWRSFNWNGDVDSELTKSLVADYDKEFGSKIVPIYITEAAYNVPLLLQAAAKTADSGDVAKITAAIPGTTVEGPSGTIEMREDNHAVLQTYIARCEGGDMKIVDGPIEVPPAKDQREDGAY